MYYNPRKAETIVTSHIILGPGQFVVTIMHKQNYILGLQKTKQLQ